MLDCAKIHCFIPLDILANPYNFRLSCSFCIVNNVDVDFPYKEIRGKLNLALPDNIFIIDN